MVGLLFADGGLPTIEQFLAHLKQDGLIERGGLVLRSPERYLKEVGVALRATIRARTFAELPVSFSCVATDIVRGEPVVLDEGDVVDAVLASAAMPGAFNTRRIGERWLVDGGVTRNLPADVLRERGATFIIGSSLYSIAEMDEPDHKPAFNRLQAAVRGLSIMQLELSRSQIIHCDFCCTPPVGTYQWFDFKHVDEILEIGRTEAQARIPELVEKLNAAGM
jgi:NTE family protein